MPKIDPQFIKEFSSGIITNVNPSLAPKNSVAFAMNLDFDEELGSAVGRLGSGIIGSLLVAGKTINGLHNDGVNGKLFAAINVSNDATQTIKDVVAGTDSLTGDTASLKTRFLTYLGSTLRLNGTDAPKAYNGTSWITTGGDFDLANMPTGYKVAIEFLDRVYLLVHGTNIDRIQYSGVATAGAVSWTVDAGTVNLEPEEGAGGLVGAGKVPGYILFFKRRSMKRWNYVSANPESMVGIGTPSHESIINTAGICGFFSDSDPDAIGFYITDGSYPTPISHLRAKNIKKWVDAIPSSYYQNIAGWGTETHMYWSIGDVTVDGVSYNNVMLRWSIKTGEWAIRKYPNEFRVFTKYVLNGVASIVGGTTAGNVIQIDKPGTYSDYVSTTVTARPIDWEILTQDENWDFNQIKTVSERFIVMGNNIEQAEGYVLSKSKKGTKLVAQGSWQNENVGEIRLKNSVEGSAFQFGVRGENKSSRVVISEIEIPNIDVTQNYT